MGEGVRVIVGVVMVIVVEGVVVVRVAAGKGFEWQFDVVRAIHTVIGCMSKACHSQVSW